MRIKKQKIKVYSSSLNYLVLNKSDWQKIDLDLNKEKIEIETSKYYIEIYLNNWEKVFRNESEIDYIKFDTDSIHIVELSILGNAQSVKNNFLDYLLKNYSNKKSKIYLVTDLSGENFYFSLDVNLQNYYNKKIERTNNIKVIHHLPYLNNNNFIFCPKILFQNFFNHDDVFTLFYYIGKIWNSMDFKKNRFGFHSNILRNGVWRKDFTDLLIEKNILSSNKFYLTANETNKYSDRLSNDEKRMYNPLYFRTYLPHRLGNVPPTKSFYFSNIFDLSFSSDIEIVGETFFTNKESERILTEKTFKNLLIGKPFISLDPISHGLVKKMGFKTYDCLFTSELLEFYSRNEKIFTQELKEKCLQLVVECVDKILRLSDSEYIKKIQECEDISLYNKNKFEKIMFEDSILKYLS